MSSTNIRKILILVCFSLLFSYSLLTKLLNEQVKDLLFLEYDFDMDKKLDGVIVPSQDITLTSSTWLDGSFQENYTTYVAENTAFRNWLIRIKNQIYFDLFGESSYEVLKVGKKDFLFETSYLTAYTGQDFVGQDSINFRVAELIKARQLLKQQGKELIILFPPSKPRFYSDLVPQPYTFDLKRPTNYSAFTKAFAQNGIPYLDFNKWFMLLKDTSSYLLLPKTGTHWTNYGAALCADSTVKYMEHLTTKKYTHFTLTNITTTYESGYAEDDLVLLLNLVQPIQNPLLANFTLDFEKDTTLAKPKVLVVSDSFYLNWAMMEIPEHVFSPESQLWYYNATAFKLNTPKRNVKELDLKAEIAKIDIVVLIAVEPNLRLFPYEFAERLNSEFK